jgi:translocation and assembly module TamA
VKYSLRLHPLRSGAAAGRASLWAALPLACCIWAAGCKTDSAAQKGPEVNSLKIEGSKQVSASDIEEKILTAESSWVPVLGSRHYFDPNIWRTDLRRIERYYRERGYYQAKVVDDHVSPTNGEVDLSVQVEEGEPTRVADIQFSGLDTLTEPESRRLKSKVPLKRGEVFLETEWQGLKDSLEAELREMGYALANVEGRATVDVDARTAKLLLEVRPGVRYKFGNGVVEQGENPRVDAWRVKEIVESVAKPGDWYTDTALNDAQDAVFQMGVFGAVRIRPGKPEPNTDIVPVVAEVRESPFHTLRLGGGVGVDQARNELRAVGQYVDRNFKGGLRKLTIGGKAGWAWLPNIYTSASAGGRNGFIAKATAELEQPRLFDYRWKATVRTELERGMEPAYSFNGGRVKLGIIWQPIKGLSIFPSYNLEAYRLEEGIALPTGTAPAILFGCPRTCVLSYLEQTIEYDRRDDAQEPRKGYYLALSLQEGGLGGSFRYFRLQPEARGYVSFGRSQRVTLAAKLKLGSLWPESGEDLDSPIVARFFSGGASMMRGFSSRRLSPYQLVPKPPGSDAPNEGILVPIGGNGLVESSVELRYNFPKAWTVATFLDVGFVSPETLKYSRFDDWGGLLQYGVGAGVRYRTPIGPIRLDFAYRPNWGPALPVYRRSGPSDPAVRVYPMDGSDLTYSSGGGCFGLGHGRTGAGSPEGPCTLHISIGEAF